MISKTWPRVPYLPLVRASNYTEALIPFLVASSMVLAHQGYPSTYYSAVLLKRGRKKTVKSYYSQIIITKASKIDKI